MVYAPVHLCTYHIIDPCFECATRHRVVLVRVFSIQFVARIPHIRGECTSYRFYRPCHRFPSAIISPWIFQGIALTSRAGMFISHPEIVNTRPAVNSLLCNKRFDYVYCTNRRAPMASLANSRSYDTRRIYAALAAAPRLVFMWGSMKRIALARRAINFSQPMDSLSNLIF